MKLREKVRLVVNAIPGASTWRRVTLFAGLAWLGAVFGGSVRAVVVLAEGHYADGVGWLAIVPIMAVFWGETWRRAVDEPMGEAWFDLPSTRHILAGGYFVAGLTLAASGSWGWAAMNFFFAVLFLVARGGRGGGWDDPIDAPRPDPSTAA